MKSITNAQQELNTLKNDVIDLFEHYETLPKEVKDIIDEFEDVNTHDGCRIFVEKLNSVGYTCEFGLDAEPFNLSVL